MVTTIASEYIIKAIFTGEVEPTVPASFFVALHTGDPGADGSANEVDTGVDDPDYARKAITFTNAALATGKYRTDNNADIVFNAAGAGASYTVTHVSIYSASTAGDCWATIELSSPRAVVEGDVIRIPINELRITGDV